MDVIDMSAYTAELGRVGPSRLRVPMTSHIAVTRIAARWLAVLLLLIRRSNRVH